MCAPELSKRQFVWMLALSAFGKRWKPVAASTYSFESRGRWVQGGLGSRLSRFRPSNVTAHVHARIALLAVCIRSHFKIPGDARQRHAFDARGFRKMLSFSRNAEGTLNIFATPLSRLFSFRVALSDTVSCALPRPSSCLILASRRSACGLPLRYHSASCFEDLCCRQSAALLDCPFESSRFGRIRSLPTETSSKRFPDMAPVCLTLALALELLTHCSHTSAALRAHAIQNAGHHV